MAATVTIRRWTGAGGGPTKTDITGANTRASTSDNPAPGTTNPIPVPAPGTNYAYWIATRLSCDVTPAGTINNLKWYTSGVNPFGTGITCLGNNATAYTQATGTPGVTGLQLTVGNYATLSGAPVNVFGFTSGAPLALAGSIVNPNTGDFGDFVVWQIQVAATAAPGTLAQATFTFQWDET